MELNNLKNKVENFLGDQALEVMESEGHKLYALPNILSRKFVAEFSGSITQILYHQEQALHDEDFKQIQKILIQAQIIKSRFDKAEINLKKVINRIKNNSLELVTEEELQEGVKIILNDQTPALEFYLEEESLYQTIIKTYCTNAAISSNIFKEGSEISLASIEKSHPRVAQHAKKTAFDQMCLLVYGHHPEQYDILRKVEEIDTDHQVNNLLDIKLKKNQILFGYVDMNPLTLPKFPRFASILSLHEGVGCSVEEIIHQTKTLPVQCIIAGVEVVVMVPVWFGVIVTKIDNTSHKPLDLDEILNQASVIVKEQPDLANFSSKLKEEPSLVNSYLNVFTKLATATNQNYAQVMGQLKKQAQGENHASR